LPAKPAKPWSGAPICGSAQRRRRCSTVSPPMPWNWTTPVAATTPAPSCYRR